MPARAQAAEKRTPDLAKDADDALRTVGLGEEEGLAVVEVHRQDARIADVDQQESHAPDEQGRAEVVLVSDAQLALVLRDGRRREKQPEELGRRLPRRGGAAQWCSTESKSEGSVVIVPKPARVAGAPARTLVAESAINFEAQIDWYSAKASLVAGGDGLVDPCVESEAGGWAAIDPALGPATRAGDEPSEAPHRMKLTSMPCFTKFIEKSVSSASSSRSECCLKPPVSR